MYTWFIAFVGSTSASPLLDKTVTPICYRAYHFRCWKRLLVISFHLVPMIGSAFMGVSNSATYIMPPSLSYTEAIGWYWALRSGKPHELEMLAYLSLKEGPRVVYLPDCRALLRRVRVFQICTSSGLSLRSWYNGTTIPGKVYNNRPVTYLLWQRFHRS